MGKYELPSPSIVHDVQKRAVNLRALKFNVGDKVMIYPQKKIGIVYAKANDLGEVGVQIYRSRNLIHYKPEFPKNFNLGKEEVTLKV